MTKKFYYLNGIDKKGPFSIDELALLNLSNDTLIWTEGFENWKPLSELPDILKLIPPPVPEDVAKLDQDIQPKSSSNFFITILIFGLITIFSAYYVISQRKEKDKKDLENKIDNIFQGRSIICDATKSLTSGEIKPVNNNDTYSSDSKRNELEKKVVSKYYCTSGGFTFKKLKKVDNGYEIESIISTNMAYKVNDYSYRPSIESAYRKAYDYFEEESSGYFLSGSFDLITNFVFLRTNYYKVENVVKPSYPNSTYWYTNEEGGYFNYDYQILYFKTIGYYYEITQDDNKVNDLILKVSIVALLIYLIISFSFYKINPFKW